VKVAGLDPKQEFKAGYDSGRRIRGPGDAILRIVIFGALLWLALVLPFPWWGRVLAYLCFILLLGVVYQAVEIVGAHKRSAEHISGDRVNTPATDRRMTIGEFLDVTPEQEAGVNKFFDTYWSTHENGHETWVKEELFYCLVAAGLWDHAERLVRFEDHPSRGGNADNFLQAADALMKSLKLVPAPIVMYQVATLLAVADAPQAEEMFRLFLSAKDQFTPTFAQKTVLEMMLWTEQDEEGAAASSRSSRGARLHAYSDGVELSQWVRRTIAGLRPVAAGWCHHTRSV